MIDPIHLGFLLLGLFLAALFIGVALWLVNGFHGKVKSVVDHHNADFMLQFAKMVEDNGREAEIHSRSVRALASSIIKIEERLDKIEALLANRSDDRDVDPV